MLYLRPWFTLLIIALGNCGFWIFWFNRINAVGLPRKTTKRIEWGIVAICFAIPLAILALEWQSLWSWINSTRWWPTDAPLTQLWGAWCAAACLVMGSLWLESRRWLFWPPRHLLGSKGTLHDVNAALDGQSASDRATARLARLPGNQICKLEVTVKELLLPRSVPLADGLRIGHLSDLHFTGKYSVEHYQFVIDRFLELQPELVLLTGDIIDYVEYLTWLEPILGRIDAPLGKYFVLGNHDQRLASIEPLLEQMEAIGYVDLGCADRQIELPSGLRLALSGNERPWFERHQPPTSVLAAASVPAVQELRIGVSHTPDQIRWAQAEGLDLLFAGHTHGGQFRPPGIGPILSPSMHGSKFASGVFYLAPTLMHVSRGASGTHPFRWWCPPEISLLTLRSES